MQVVLIYPTPTGSKTFEMSGNALTIGRGAVDLRFDDESMSRYHATIHREGDNIWILDEGSTNGTFVNGIEVAPNGTILKDGDQIRVGNHAILKVSFKTEETKKAAIASASGNSATSVKKPNEEESFGKIPLIITGIAILIITLVGGGIAANILLKPKEKPPVEEEIVKNTGETEKKNEADKPKPSGEDSRPTLKKGGSTLNTDPGSSASASVPGSGDAPLTNSPQGTTPSPTNPNFPLGKTYQEMSDVERRAFIEFEGQKIARVIGNSDGEAIPPEAVNDIKRFLDAYAKRLRSDRKDDCTGKGWLSSDLQSLLERASKNAHFINEAFTAQKLPPQIGLYLAMIESEHCTCLQSYTGPLGMFQFTFATAKSFYPSPERVVKGSTPANPDIRCEPKPSAEGAARYMDFLIGRYGRGSRSFPLAIASYNSGEGALNQNLQEALNAARTEERSFWTMIAKADALSNKYADQFRRENKHYVPKFFAAAIIGENPPAFGIKMPPLSSYTK